MYVPYTPPSDNIDRYEEPDLKKYILNAKLVEFDLSLRILIPLEDAGIRTMRDLSSRTRESVAKINQLGVKAVGILERLLTRYGLSFAEE